MGGMGGMGMGMGGMGGMGNMGANGMGGMNAGARPPKQLGTGNSAMQASKMGSGIVDESAKQWWVGVAGLAAGWGRWARSRKGLCQGMCDSLGGQETRAIITG